MKSKTNIITSKQLIFTIIGSTIGVGIFTLTSTVVRDAKQDVWISTLMGSLLPLLGIFMLHLINRKFPDLSFAEYSEKVLSKWPGKMLSLLFVLYTMAFAAVVARIFVDILKTYLFPVTPVWALGILILLVSAYLASKDARVLGRVNELVFYESLFLFVFILGAVPKIDISFFRPVGQAGLTNILMGSYDAVFAFLGLEVLLVFYSLVQNKKEIGKASLPAVLIITIIYLMVALAVLGIFGPEVTEHIRFGLMGLLKTYQAPMIERGEFFFIIFWVFVAFRPVANMYFVSRYTMEKIMGVNSPLLMTVLFLPFLLIVILLPQNFEQALSFSSYLGLVGIAFITVIPLGLWAIAMLRGIGGEQGNA